MLEMSLVRMPWPAVPLDVMLILQGQGVAKFRSFWRGMGVTLAKDVPFAAAYWSLLEPLRSTMLPKDAPASTPQVQNDTECLNLAASSAMLRCNALAW